MDLKKVDVRGVSIADVTLDEAAQYIEERLALGETTAVYTPNSEIVQKCIGDEEYRGIINSAELVIPDGIGVVKASKILGDPVREKVAGIDLGYKVFEIAEKEGYPIYFFGGSDSTRSESGRDIAVVAAEKLKEKYPLLNIVAHRHGYYAKNGEENEETIRHINESGAKILFVCLGFPTQEYWIHENRSKLPNVKLYMALGGSLDGYSGAIKRAPKIFIRLGLEWFYRLLRQPTRIIRMMSLPKFYFGTWIYKFKRK